MKKLDQRGWGLSVFLAFIVVFFIAIVLISIGAQKVGLDPYSNVSNPTTSVDPNVKHYTDSEISEAVGFESSVRDSAARYFMEVYGGQWSEDRSILTVSKLIEKSYLQPFSVAGNSCGGYVKVQSSNGELSYIPYIQCGEVYMTEGFDYSLE